MVGCSVLGCKSRSEQNLTGITFHQFPSNPSTRLKWVETTGKIDFGWQPTKYSKMCSLHFSHDSFIYKQKLVVLKSNSVPIKLIHMPSCIVPSCLNVTGSHNKSLGISFHRFPSNDEETFKTWCLVLRMCCNDDLWVPTKYTTICSVHFDPNDKYQAETGHWQLHPGAIPKLLLFGQPKMNKTSDETISPCPSGGHKSQSSTFQHCSPKLTVSFQKATSVQWNSTEVLATDDTKESMETKKTSSIFFSCCKCGHSHEVGGLINTLTLMPQTATIMNDLTLHVPPDSRTSVLTPQIPNEIGGPSSLSHKKLMEDNHYLQEQLKKKDMKIKTKTNMIRSLNQKIKRFTKKNEDLKKILVYMKEKYQ